MNKNIFSLTIFPVIIIFLMCNITVNAKGWQKEFLKGNGKSTRDFNEIKSWADNHFKKTRSAIKQELKKGNYPYEAENEAISEYVQYKRWEWFWQDRLNADGTLGIMKDFRQQPAKTYLKSALIPAWKRISFDSNSGGYWGMGRAESIGFHPTDINTYYVGSIGGGLWKTTDGGLNYTSIGDDLPLTQVGHILVNYNNPDIIYISQGPRGGWWTHNMGIYKSTDGGLTFQPTALASEYSDGKPVTDFIMSPDDPDVLLVSRSDGIYRTEDGGSTWQQVKTGYFGDMAWRPGDSDKVYAASEVGGNNNDIYVSTNAGKNWQVLADLNSGSNLKIAVTPANPDVLTYSSGSSFYVSTDNGQSFTKKTDLPENWEIVLSNEKENIMYACGINVHKSTDSGNTWEKISMWWNDGSAPEVHADVRNINHNPLDTGVVYFCNDGGISKYDEREEQWTELDDGLVITQYYRISCAQTDSFIVQGGTQDNGGNRRRADGTWYNTNGGDAMEQAIDPTNPDIMYTTYINGLLYKSTDAWQNNTYQSISDNIPGGTPNGAWVTPYKLDSNNPAIIVVGYDNVWYSDKRGNAGSWKNLSENYSFAGNLKCLEVAKSNSEVIYASVRNMLYKTTDLGKSWESFVVPGADNITRIAIHPESYDTLWVSKGGFTDGSKIYKSVDGGEKWENISGIIPNIPVNCIIYENGSNDALYVGTDNSVYYRNGAMSDWIEFSEGLPNTIVSDLDINYMSNKLVTGTYGRGIWQIDLFKMEDYQYKPQCDFASNTTHNCSGEIRFSDNSMYGDRYEWDFGDGNKSVERNPVHDYGADGVYSVKLITTNDYGADTLIKNNYITVNLVQPPVTSYDTICVGDDVTLAASGNGALFWYGQQYDGDLLHVGDSLTIAAPTNTTTYYVEERSSADTIYKVGPTNKDFSTGDNYTFDGNGLLFDVYKTILLKSFKVYAQGGGVRTFELLTGVGGELIAQKEVYVPDGESRVEVNFVVEAGNQYFIKLSGSVNLFRNDGGATFPFTIPDVVSITETNVAADGFPGYYYFFYDWRVMEVGNCPSKRMPAQVSVGDIPAKPEIEMVDSTLQTTDGVAHYQWFKDGSPIENSDTSNYKPVSSGIYKVEVSNELGCSSVSDNFGFYVVSAPLIANTYFNVFPNPNDGAFTISFKQHIPGCTIKIHNLSGQEVYTKKLAEYTGNVEVDISNFSKGVYIIQVLFDNQVITEKILYQ